MVFKACFILLLVVAYGAADFDKCRTKDEDKTITYPTEVCMDTVCMEAINDQIREELKAACFYLDMGAHFGRDNVNRPGMAKFMFEAATEERSHAIQMLEYLSMRGKKIDMPSNICTLFTDQTGLDILSALEKSLSKEIEVTKLIVGIVEKCSKDFHGADVFTNPILDEQHNGIRKLQGAIRTYRELVKTTETGLAKYLFDRKVLKGEIL